MSAVDFEWTQPVGGKKVSWRPLKVGDQMDLDANYGRADVAYLRKYAGYAKRIMNMEGLAPGQKPQVNDLREWDEYDLEAFAEEVAMREMARANALSAQRPGSPILRLEQAIESAQLAASKLGEELKNVLAAAKQTEQQLGPLTHKS